MCTSASLVCSTVTTPRVASRAGPAPAGSSPAAPRGNVVSRAPTLAARGRVASSARARACGVVASASASHACARCALAVERSGLRATTSSASSSQSTRVASPNRRRSHTRRGRALAAVDDATGIPERNLRKDMSAKEYADLKATLFKTTAAYGAGLTAYSTLGYGLANGFSAALGSGAGLVYLYLLGKYVDELEPNDGEFDDLYTRNLVYEPVNDVFGMLGGAFGKVGQVYSQALLQKRLLVPVVVAAGTSAFNALDFPFDFNYGPVLLGFLTYKAAVLTKLYEDLKPDIISAITGAGGEKARE